MTFINLMILEMTKELSHLSQILTIQVVRWVKRHILTVFVNLQ
jgi:hypothetical protein